jgi:hypothetical protein
MPPRQPIKAVGESAARCELTSGAGRLVRLLDIAAELMKYQPWSRKKVPSVMPVWVWQCSLIVASSRGRSDGARSAGVSRRSQL